MISPKVVKLIEFLPEGLITFVSRKVVNHLIKKYVDLKIEGQENLLDIKKPVIFICNHLSNSDALILDKVLKNHDVTYVAGVKLSQNATTNLGVRLVKTTTLKPNSADKEGLKRVINLIKEGNNVVIFPEGTRSRTGKMIEAKKGILLIAKVTGATIMPVGLWGTEKFLPINDAGNMSAESFHYAKIGVKVGQKIEIPQREQGEDKLLYEDRALNTMMKSIAELIPEEYRGVYK